MKRNEQRVLAAMFAAGGAVLLGAWLISEPKCDRGCKTVAEHLLEHGLQDFFVNLLSLS